jgi:hypothetical protein
MNTTRIQNLESETVRTVVTRGVRDALSADEIRAAVTELREKMKTPDPENPNLWTVQVGPHTLWGILDEHAGPNGENVFTVLFPSEY